MDRDTIIRMARIISNSIGSNATPNLEGENQIERFFLLAYELGRNDERNKLHPFAVKYEISHLSK